MTTPRAVFCNVRANRDTCLAERPKRMTSEGLDWGILGECLWLRCCYQGEEGGSKAMGVEKDRSKLTARRRHQVVKEVSVLSCVW